MLTSEKFDGKRKVIAPIFRNYAIASIFPKARSHSSSLKRDRVYLYQSAIAFIFPKMRSYPSFRECDRIHICESAIAS
ncbi:hypothetical protein NDI37_17055 [Funiculus sociatus GB2-A5]|uniref:Uncharacterized protein n=1 Tax=Funiculus sociatus GB2-A5 TaxID=2933946 RepID=A0ABV0JRT8_9CYAN|nr:MULTISPECIES: hypothetical protein [unclassified Trichocoleus]MBD1904325.1 hypothetical protein [Trichocoleus sp. FACHB-832]MBD2065024.1 hypothetical protein [Trichocoleus sp. FACHB-6]